MGSHFILYHLCVDASRLWVRPLPNMCYHWAAVGNIFELSWSIMKHLLTNVIGLSPNNGPAVMNFGGAGLSKSEAPVALYTSTRKLCWVRWKNWGMRSQLGKLITNYVGTLDDIDHDFVSLLISDLRVLAQQFLHLAPPSEVLVFARFLALWRLDVNR